MCVRPYMSPMRTGTYCWTLQTAWAHGAYGTVYCTGYVDLAPWPSKRVSFNILQAAAAAPARAMLASHSRGEGQSCTARSRLSRPGQWVRQRGLILRVPLLFRSSSQAPEGSLVRENTCLPSPSTFPPCSLRHRKQYYRRCHPQLQRGSSSR